MRKLGKAQRVVADCYIQYITRCLAEETHRKQVDKLIEVTSKLTEDDRFSYNGFWKVARALNKRTENKSIVLSRDGTELRGPSLIVGAYKDEFQFRLRNREIVDELQEFEQVTEELVEHYLKYASRIKDEPPFTLEELKGIISCLQKKTPGGDLIHAAYLKHAGDGMLISALDLFNYMKESLCIPARWHKVIITTIFKNKGSRRNLVNYRGIFLTAVLSKVFERLIKGRIDCILIVNVNIMQAGARLLRGPIENLFLLRGVLDYCRYIKTPVYITLYDFTQAFDSHWLHDSILSMWNAGIQNELLSLIFELNRQADVTVKTPFGVTEEFNAPLIVKQGTVY